MFLAVANDDSFEGFDNHFNASFSDYSQVVPDFVEDERNDYIQPWFHDPQQQQQQQQQSTTSSPIDIPRKHNNSYHRHHDCKYSTWVYLS